MQLFFWFSIILLAFASFVFVTIPFYSNSRVSASLVHMPRRLPIIIFASLLVLGSVGLYVILGSSHLLSVTTKPPIEEKYTAIIKQIEDHLAKNPEDAEGWQVVAPTYLSLNQPEKAFQAYANAIKFGNSTGKNWLGLGKSNLIVNKGVFGPMTKVAFTKASEKSPDDIETMYFYAAMLQNEQDTAAAKQAINSFIENHDYTTDQLLPLTEMLANMNQSEADK